MDYFALLKGVTAKKERQRLIQEVLELVNLYDARKKHVSGYSGGMKQRFGIAQLLLNNPKLIIVDEPTAGLDPAERKRFHNILREIGTRSTVIFSTHIVEDVKALCTDLAIMNNGKILQHNSPTEATQALENKIWTTNITREQLEQAENNYNIVSSSYTQDNLIDIRIYAENSPNDTFQVATPDLEDVYFLALK